MARIIHFILCLSIIGVALCAPSEDTYPGEDRAGEITTQQTPQTKQNSNGGWLKTPFNFARGVVDFGSNVRRKTIDVAEKMTNRAINASLVPVKYFGEKIPATIARQWRRIHIQGQPADDKDYPYVVRILKGTDEQAQLCGGAIISEKIVLTAAHCFDEIEDSNEIHILAGSDTLSHKSKQLIQVVDIVKHSAYDQVTLNFDIAVLKLKIPLKYAPEVKNILLPESSDNAEEINGGKGVVFGTCPTSNHLLSASVLILPLTKCAKYFDVYTNQLCVGNDKVVGNSTCTAESGFPLVQKINGRDILKGIASYGSEECEKTPTMYSSVSEHALWIKETFSK